MKAKLRISKSVLLEASVQELAATSVASVIGRSAYDKIKAKDDHPMFVKLDVGNQGESGGAVIFSGIKKLWRKIWSSKRIKEIAKWLDREVPLFFGHGVTNSQKNRRKIGKTVKGWTEELKDGLHAFSIGYIPSKYVDIQEMIRKKEIDICSIEAQLEFSLLKLGKLFVEKIKDLSAVALGSTQLGQVPGFSTAGIVGVVQEMAGTKEALDIALKEAGIDPEDVEIEFTEDVGEKKTRRKRRMGTEAQDLSIEEVITCCKTRKIKPEEIYSLDELLKVGAVKDAVENEASELSAKMEEEKEEETGKLQEEIDSRDQKLKDKDGELQKVMDDLTAKDKEIQPFKLAQRQGKVAALVTKSLLLKDKPQQMTDYICSHTIVPDDVDLDGEGVSAAIEQAVQSQLDDIEASGISFKEKKDPEDPENEGEGGDPEVGFGDNNPFQPEYEKEKEKEKK